MKTKTILFLACLFIVSTINAGSPPVETGKLIFSSRCAGCHNVNQTLTGPALAGIAERRSLDWIVNFVHSSQSLIKSGDKTAVELFNKFNKIPMPDHRDLSADDIKSVVEFIKSESKPVSTDAAPFATPGKLRPSYTPISINNYGFFIVFISVVLLLAAGLVALVSVKQLARKAEVEG
jgi:cytochrome c551/c552